MSGKLCLTVEVSEWVSVKKKNRLFLKQENKQLLWSLATLAVQFCRFAGNVRIRWVTKGCWWIFYFLIFDWSSVCLSRNHLPTCCAGFEVCPPVMITYEHISRPRRLITISRTPAHHTPFEYSVFVSWLYVAWASCYQFMGHLYAQLRWVPHNKHILTCWR